MSPELKQKLKQALAGRQSVDMGQFQFLGLDRVREEAGSEWPHLRDKVYEVGNHFIEKRVGAEDAVIRCDGGYLIIFKSLEGEFAEAVVREISAELERFFLGERKLDFIRVRGEARAVTTEELLQIVAETQDEDRTERAAPRKAATAGDSEPAPSWKATASRVREDDGRTRWVKAPVPERAPRPTIVTRPEAAYKERDGVWDDIVFRPSWDSRKSALIHNFCLARRIVKGVAYYGRDTLMGSDHREDHRALDRAVALAAQRGFQAGLKRGGKSVIVVPVHYDTIATISQRMSYFAVLQSVPEAMRRYFFLRVDGVPAGAPIGQMQELFRSMKHFGAYVLAHLDYGMTDFQRFEGCGIGIFGAETPARINDHGPTDKDLNLLVDWSASARLLQAETYLTAVEHADVLNAGMSAGVRYFSGDLVAPEAALPAPARALSAGEILTGRDAPDAAGDIFRLD